MNARELNTKAAYEARINHQTLIAHRGLLITVSFLKKDLPDLRSKGEGFVREGGAGRSGGGGRAEDDA